MLRPLLVVLVALAPFACNSSSLPGSSLGTFAVTATIASNTCGSSIGAPSPWSFDAEMSKDGSTLYWQQGTAASVSGVLDSSNKSTITVTSTAGDDAGACVMSETDTIALTLDSATAPTTVSGTLTYTFGASSTTDCAAQLSGNGGSYQTLPCTVSYTMSGKKQ